MDITKRVPSGRAGRIREEIQPSYLPVEIEMLSKGVRLQVVPVRDYKVELKDFDALIDHRTRLVAVSLVSLTTGLGRSIPPVRTRPGGRAVFVNRDRLLS